MQSGTANIKFILVLVAQIQLVDYVNFDEF